MQSVVITGVSTGIGFATAQACIRAGYRVFGSVRAVPRGEQLQAQLGERFVPLVFDVRDAAAVRNAAAFVGTQLGGAGLAGLVNNAGIAVPGPLLHQSLEQVREQFEVNALAPLGITQAFAPLLGATMTPGFRPGRVINITSVAGKVVAPFMGAYAASKHALEALSEGMRRELQLYGIDVIVIGPGSVESPIWDKEGGQRLRHAFGETDYAQAIDRFLKYIEGTRSKFWPAKRIGDVVVESLRVAHPKARYAPVQGWLANWALPRLLPARWVDRAIGGQLALSPRSATQVANAPLPVGRS